MKKLVYILIGVMCIGCSHKEQTKCSDSDNDSIVTIYAVGGEFKVSLDSFMQVKDSFVYCKEEGLWMTKELYMWNYGYPETIKVAFTRNGVFEDSVEAVRRGVIEDSTGKDISPAYVYGSFVGDNWTYDLNGKFIEFNCTVRPHSGAPHHYKP